MFREALVDILDNAAWARLVVLRAPAGFGKTTAMAQEYRRLHTAGVRTAWLTLDSADNDAPRLSASLNTALANFGSAAARTLMAPADAISMPAGVSSRFALFLDDFELIQDLGALSIIKSIVDVSSDSTQIFIGSRIVPALGLAKLRAHGHLLEIDAETLRFSLQETQRFTNERQLGLSSDQIERLHVKSEGWIAAIWLASLSIGQQRDVSGYLNRFSGSTQAIAEFLTEDVLASQPNSVQEFLLNTSILRTLEARICQVLVPQCDAAEMLRALERHNLFLVSVAGVERTYRYHQMFVEFLRERLRRDHPQRFKSLHVAASDWYAGHGRHVAAIDHAFDAGDLARALALLTQHAPSFLEQGRFRMLARWFDEVPRELLDRHPVLGAISVWATLLTRGAKKASAELATLKCRHSKQPHVLGYVNALGPLLLGIQDSYEDALPAAKAALTHIPTGNAFADGVLCNAAAYFLSVTGAETEARRLVEGARSSRAESAFVRMYSESLNGLMALQAARLSEAIGRFKFAISASHTPYNEINANAWAGVLYAATLYERNHLDMASRLLDVHMPVALEAGLPDHVILGHLIRARIAYSRGDIDAAFELLVGLEYVGYDRGLPRLIASAKLERARLFLLQENMTAARDELTRAGDPAVWTRVRDLRLVAHDTDDIVIGRLRWDAQNGDPKDVLCDVEEELLRADRQRRQRRALVLRMVQSVGLQRGGKPAAAMDVMAGVLRHASREGFVRLILDEGEPVLRLVRRFQSMQQEASIRGSDPILLAYLRKLIDAVGSRSIERHTAPTDHLIQPLSRKEVQTLEQVAAGASNARIAEKLGVSQNTVRTHLRNVNAKLSARSRNEAVAIARRLDVIR